MREIKFRVWDKSDSRMITAANCQISFCGSIMSNAGYDVSDSYILMQFTGLKDKNGVGIYEGDIVKFTQHRAYNEGSFVGKIVFDNKYASFGIIKNNSFIKDYIEHFSEFHDIDIDLLSYLEVVGSIHETQSY